MPVSDNEDVMTDTDQLPPPQLPPPSAPPPPRRLVRVTEGRAVAGVARGLADYFQVDPTLVRVIFGVSVFFGALGVFAYLALWVALPADDGTPSLAQRVLDREGGALTWVGLGLVALAFALLLDRTSHFFGLAGLAGPIALVATGGVLLWWGQRDEVPVGPGTPQRYASVATPTAPSGAAPAGGTTDAPADAEAPDDEVTDDLSEPATPIGDLPPPAWPPQAPARWREPRPPRPPRPPKPRSILGRVTLALSLFSVAIAAIVNNLLDSGLNAGHYLAIALLVVGLGLVVGTFFGRARWLSLIGLLLLPFVVASNLFGTYVTTGLGDRYFAPTTADSIASVYELGIGELTVDLRSIEIPVGDPILVAAQVGVGQLELILPEGAGLVLSTATVNAGQVRVFGVASDDGAPGASLNGLEIEPQDGRPTFTIDAEVGIGQLDIWFDNWEYDDVVSRSRVPASIG